MPEPIIHDSTPKGSAILAYGESRRPLRFPLILAVLAGMIAFACLALGAALYAGRTLPLPTGTAILVYAKPGADLPSGIPELWKRARASSGPFPVLLGFREDAATGDLKPFAIVPRFAARDGAASWAFRLLADDAMPDAAKRSPRSLTGSLADYAAPAWLRIWPAFLLKTSVDPRDDASIGGAISRGRWITDARVSGDAETLDRVSGQNMVAIRAVPDAWPAIESMLREQGMDIRLTTAPSVVSWTAGSESISIRMHFDDPLATTTIAELAGGMGVVDRYEYALEDGTLVTELRLPTDPTARTADWASENGRIVFQENDVILGDPALFDTQTEIPPQCRGPVIAILDGKGLNNLLTTLHLPALYTVPDRLIWLEQNGRVVACW